MKTDLIDEDNKVEFVVSGRVKIKIHLTTKIASFVKTMIASLVMIVWYFTSRTMMQEKEEPR